MQPECFVMQTGSNLVNIRQHHRLGKKVRDTDAVILYNILHGEYFALPIQQIKAAYEQQY